MKNLNRFLMLTAALWVTAGTANAAERVTNGTFTANAGAFKNTSVYPHCGITGNPTTTSGVGTDTAGIKYWSMAGLGSGNKFYGVGGTGTNLGDKNFFGPTDYGSRTYALVQQATGQSQLYQAITLPVGFYKIQYDVACTKGYSANYNVVLTNSTFTDTPYSSGQKAASNAAFVTVTDYFGRGGSAAQTIYLQNATPGIYVCFANVSIQDATPPAPTVSNNTPINQGDTVTLTASSPYTTDPNAFNWNGPVLTNYKGSNLSFANAQPGWSGNYTCTVTVNGATSVAASTTVTINALPTTFAITASSGSNGTVSPDGVTNVNSGGSQAYTITPATGCHIDQVLVDGVNNPGAVSSGSYTFSSVTATHTIAASFAINTYNITSSAGDNGSISPNGSTSVNYNDSQAYTITPATGYHVADVLVDGGSVGAVTSYTFSSVTATHTIGASFAINTYNITSSAGDYGSISPNGSTSVNYNGSQTYTIAPVSSSYVIQDVLVDGSSVGAVTSYTFYNVTTTHTITATYSLIPTTITVTQTDHGTISPGTTTPTYGGNQTFSITPDTGYAVGTLTVDGSPEDVATNYMFMNVTTTHTITATYSLIPTTITVTQTANGTISPDTTTPIYGENQAFSITPSTGYAVATLTVDGGPVDPATSYTFTNVTATHSISATFHTLYQAWLDANSKPDNEASLKEYAFGTTNPGAIVVIDDTHITLGQSPAMQITDGVVSAVFGRRTDHEGLTYTVEFCDDLGTWYPSSDTEHLRYDGPVTAPVVIAHEGDMDAVKIPFPIFIKVGEEYVKMSKTFMRIVVTTN